MPFSPSTSPPPSISLTSGDRFWVAIHDVAPRFREPIDAILQDLRPLIGDRLTAAVTPRWHGEDSSAFLPEYGDWLRSRFGEWLLHGWTHRRDHRPGLVSLATGRADECGGLSHDAFNLRLRRAQEEFQRVAGMRPRGFLPPAWRLPIGGRSTLRQAGFEFTVGYAKVRRLDGGGPDLPLATWSWDWGKIAALGRLGEWTGQGRARWTPRAVPCAAIHPIDLERGHSRRAVALIRRWLEQGRRPSTVGDLLGMPSGWS